MAQTKILNYINVFRGLAILLIVAGHTMQVTGKGNLLHNLDVELVCGGTALFIFISGFLFQHLSYKFEYKNYLTKKWHNVVLPYFFTSIAGLIFCFTMPKIYLNAFDGLPVLAQIPMMLTTGRVHNVPSWFIPMIVIFFFVSPVLLYLEKKNILYKLLPVLFLVTVVLTRVDVDYNSVLGLTYGEKYFAYVNYILMGFVHFFSLYVFGMYCSKNKDIIDKFYKWRYAFIFLMVIAAAFDIYSTQNFHYTNVTISKIFLTIVLLCYLKHYDNWLISHTKLNKALDFLAKYSFGLFFVHWYLFFVYNQIFHLENVLQYTGVETLFAALFRFIGVTFASLFILYLFKKLLLKINPETKTRSFIGV